MADHLRISRWCGQSIAHRRDQGIDLAQRRPPRVIAIPGGLPVKVGDVIAGVGVSGSPGVQEPCVQAGIDKAANQLK
jgi:uncharacterized protein GlcG (DUF336 family)